MALPPAGQDRSLETSLVMSSDSVRISRHVHANASGRWWTTSASS